MKNWTIAKLANQKGKVFIITGANSGLGYTAAKELASKGAIIVMAVRSLENGKAAKIEILKEVPSADIAVMQLDLADLDSVRKFSEAFRVAYDRLDVLINNAGIMMPNDRMLSEQGFELQLATNHFGHFVLASELMPLLEATAGSRVVTVSSIATKMKVAKIYFDDLQFEKRYEKMPSYSQSKLANIMFALELNKKLQESSSKVISVAAHPGYTATNLQQHMGLLGTIMNALMAQKQEMGVLPILRAATAPEVKGGDYFGPTKMGEYRGYPELVTPPELALDAGERQKLWALTEVLTAEQFRLGRE
jgi:NAD(P)-dependent dehydrogenase (short-subunit alcohol dehydrogenase family)